MVRWHALLIALCLLTAPAAAQQQAAEGAVQAVLPAGASWMATRVTVQRGQGLRISAQGRWSAITPAQSVTAAPRDTSTDANGYPNMPAGRGAPLPNANRGALVGRIGENGAPFLIGAAYRGRAPADGVLFVTMNEPTDQMRDNQGRLALSINVLIMQDAPQRVPQEQPQRVPQQPPQREPAPNPPTTQTPGAAPTPTPAPTRTPPPPTSDPAPAPAEPPAQTAPPQTPEPPPADAATPAPDASPPSAPSTPAPQPSAADTPVAETNPNPPDLLRYGLIGAAILVGLLIIALAMRPRGVHGRTRNIAAARVGARVLHDGVAGQSLSIRPGRRT